MNKVTPLFYEDDTLSTKKPSIFLAGPTVRGGTYEDNSWRKDAIALLEDIGYQLSFS